MRRSGSRSAPFEIAFSFRPRIVENVKTTNSAGAAADEYASQSHSRYPVPMRKKSLKRYYLDEVTNKSRCDRTLLASPIAAEPNTNSPVEPDACGFYDMMTDWRFLPRMAR